MNYTCFLIENFDIAQLNYIVNYFNTNGNLYRLHNFMPMNFKIDDYKNHHIDLVNLHLCEYIEPIYSLQTSNLTNKQISELTQAANKVRVISEIELPQLQDFHKIHWKNRKLLVGNLNPNNIMAVNKLLSQPIRNISIFENDIVILEKTTFKDHNTYSINLNRYDLIKNYCNNIDDVNIEKIIIGGFIDSFLIDNTERLFNNIEFAYLNLYDKSFNLLSHIDFHNKQIYLYLKDDEINDFRKKFYNPQNNVQIINATYSDITTLDTYISVTDNLDLDLNLIIEAVKEIIHNI
jgi:hypothetical protein